MGQNYKRAPKGAAVFDDAKRWEGWGTALKPAHEPVALARKPLSGTVAATMLAHGAGALNIDACRISGRERTNYGIDGDEGSPSGIAVGKRRRVAFNPSRVGEASACRRYGEAGATEFHMTPGPRGGDVLGRWPANVLTDGSLDVLEAFPSSARDAIRFFYAPKADKAEREFGLAGSVKKIRSGVGAPRDGDRSDEARANIHPTVKPIDLMAWLCRLTTAPGGIILEPFMGSGSTGIAAVRHGFGFIGIEQSPEYFDIACRRIRAAVEAEESAPRFEHQITKAIRAVQQELFAGAL